jgi:hypothetical protein
LTSQADMSVQKIDPKALKDEIENQGDTFLTE